MTGILALLLGAIALVEPQSSNPNQHAPGPWDVHHGELESGWRKWLPFFFPMHGSDWSGEHVSALVSGEDDSVWFGSSEGRLASRQDGEWTHQAWISGGRGITGIAFQGERVWLSTSEGLMRLTPEDGKWTERVYPERMTGEPRFVSGGILPPSRGERLWGWVDDVFMPSSADAWGPFAISKDLGLYAFQESQQIWQTFLPHYWGANSAWLDTRELLPLRRPTCMAESAGGDLWIGSEGDGLVRLLARGLDDWKRGPEQAVEDPDVIERHDAARVGLEFDRVRKLVPAEDGSLWAVLENRGGESRLACFDGVAWEPVPLRWPDDSGHPGASGHRLVTLLELSPGRMLLVADSVVAELDVDSGRVQAPVEIPDADTFDSTVLDAAIDGNGSLWLAAGDRLLQRPSTR